MASWTFLTTHARVLLLVAHDPGVRLRDIAASLDITERSAFGIITDLVEAGYVIKEKDGRRNRYHVQAHLPLPEPTARERTVGEVLGLLAGTDATVTYESAAADQGRGDLPPGEPPARPAAVADRNGQSPRSATQGGRRQGRDRRMGSER
ncbi:MAG: helix-turn-helix domain-containing protein [Streptosporangiaceae bacterium]